jgi:hypothetical protein
MLLNCGFPDGLSPGQAPRKAIWHDERPLLAVGLQMLALAIVADDQPPEINW